MSDLSRLHDAISTTLKAAMPQLETVASYTDTQPDTQLPALFHAIVGLRPGVDPGDGHSCIVARFEARIVVDASRPGAALEATALATQLMVLLRKQYWDIEFVEEARAIQAQPLATAPSSWTLQWEQVLHLGQAQWPWPNQPPGSLVFSFDPDTGVGHEDSYKAPEDFA